MNLFGVTPLVRALGGLAVALLVVGAGAAIGISTSHPGHTAGPGRPAARSAPPTTAGTTATSSTVPESTTAPSTTTATTVPEPIAAAGSPAGSSSGARTSPGGSGSGGSATPTTTAPAPASRSGAGTTPAPGTYSYATSGSQTLFSNTSNYPSTTTIVVTRQGCGVSDQWNSSPGNSTTIVECPVAGGVHVVSESTTVNQNGYQNSMTFQCAANSFVPTSGTPGQTWTWSCTASNGETSSQVVRLVGPQTMSVAGQPVSTEHVRIDSTLSGPEKGTAAADYWLTPNATAVHEVGAINASAFGITYTSNYTLQLDSLSPSP